MQTTKRLTLALASLALSLCMTQAHATAVLEVTSVKTYTDSVQVIAGDQVLNSGAVPKPISQSSHPNTIQSDMPTAILQPAPAMQSPTFLEQQTPNINTYQPTTRDQITASIYKLRMHQKLHPSQVQDLSTTIDALARYYNLDPMLLVSLVAVESSFNPTAISSSGAIGLGQLKPDTARWLGVQNPWDMRQNLWGVAKYMRYLLNRYNGSVPHALAAYYTGQGTVDKQGIGSGAQGYISRVNRYFAQL
jgi:soluble lytic murein transglycosylase-like protein